MPIDKTRKIKITKSETSQTFNLKDLLGRTPTSEEKQAFADAAINRIIDRTLDGKTINNTKFKRYSKEYADLKGVTRDSVDMFLSGSMLESIDELSTRGNTVKIGIDGGEDALKSYNHNIGDTVPKRQYFGLSKKETREIAKDIKSASRSLLGSLTKPLNEREQKSFTIKELQRQIDELDIDFEI